MIAFINSVLLHSISIVADSQLSHLGGGRLNSFDVQKSEKQRSLNFKKDHFMKIPTKTFHLHDVFPALRLYISLEIKFQARLTFKARPKILRPTL